MYTEHFNYVSDGNVCFPENIQKGFEITNVKFLVPVRIEAKQSGLDQVIVGQIDLVGKELYSSTGAIVNQDIQDKVFEFLAKSTTLPEEDFSAPEEVYEQVCGVQEEKDNFLADELKD